MSKNNIESSERTEIIAIRDDNDRITQYSFEIYKRDRDPFIGSLSREDLEYIMHNYTNKGAGLTQKEIARAFPQFTFSQVKDIIRAFNITKADLPLAPHEREELSPEEQYEKVLRLQENAVIKRIEANEVRELQNTYKKVAIENFQLKKQLDSLNDFSSSIKVDNLPKWEVSRTDVAKDVYIWLSDMHIGAWVDEEESLYGKAYNEDVVKYRLRKIFNKIASIPNIRHLVICNLGDSLDGMDQQTTRRDHILPQNMTNNKQLETFVSCMTEFFYQLRNGIKCQSISYYCVGDSNHDGSFGRAANRILQLQIKQFGINATIYDKFMDGFKIGDLSVILCHGKDSRDMKKPLPIVINPQTEVKINQFINIYGVSGKKILFVKGDSHTSAVTYGSNFVYKSVGAFIGATKWSSANFGNTLPICDYSIIDSDCNILDGQIDLR